MDLGPTSTHPTPGATVGSVVVAAVVVVALLPVAIKRLRNHGVLDRPSTRSSHSWATPRGAGLVTGPALGIALILGWSPVTASLAVVAIAATVLGGLEDLKGVGVWLRLGGQAAIGGLFLALTWRIGTPLALPIAVGSVVFVVGFTNAFNFMDGINGISGSVAAVTGFAYMALGAVRDLPDLRLAGAALAVTSLCFLPFNFPTARVFLGDSGSYSFGAVIACTALAGWRAGIPPDAGLAPLALYLGDTGTVVAKRLVRRRSLTVPHRTHAYQRLAQLQESHTKSTATVLTFTVTATGMGLASLRAGTGTRVALDVAICVVVATFLALPLLLGRRGGPSVSV